jgi:hypothetical protein
MLSTMFFANGAKEFQSMATQLLNLPHTEKASGISLLQ